MNPFEMVVAIVAIVMIAGVLRAKLGVGRAHRGEHFTGRHQASGQASVDAERLRDEVRSLKERVAVLERLVTDQSTSLDREFEKLKNMD
jgi:hypothetical protein